jgi:hypothetical protein
MTAPRVKDYYNRSAKEIAGFFATSVVDGEEVAAPGSGTPWLQKTILADPPGQSTRLNEFPSVLTDLDPAAHFLMDFTNIPKAYMSMVILDADGCLGECRIQYLRPSDNTWRYLDGVGKPRIVMNTAGRILSPESARLEADARGRRWCRIVGINGDDIASPIIGHVQLHSGDLSDNLPYDIFDWNPTEGSGTVITDKNGSGVDITLVNHGPYTGPSPVWIGTPQGVRYDHTGIYAFNYGIASHSSLVMAQSSALLYVKMPPLWTVGGYLCAHNPQPSGLLLDRRLYIDGADGKLKLNIHAGGSYKNVTSTSTFGVDDEFFVAWTHDGTTLRLWINGVEEDSIACGDAASTSSPFFQIAGGWPSFSDLEPPSNGGIFGSTGPVIGRVVASNRGLTATEMAALYAEFKAQYPGLP